MFCNSANRCGNAIGVGGNAFDRPRTPPPFQGCLRRARPRTLRKDVRIADTAHAPPPLEGEKGRAARLPDGKAACCAKLALSRVGSVESADTQPEMRLSEKGGWGEAGVARGA